MCVILCKRLGSEDELDMAISIGNSNIRVAAAFEQSLQIWKIAVAAEDLSDKLKNICSTAERPLKRCIISSVKPELTDMIYRTLHPLCRSKPIVASLGPRFLLDYSGYNGLLGIDRAICCEAAYLLQKTPFIMIDLGTASTINVIDNKKRFIGGLIFPGVQMGLSALSEKTALLPHADLQLAAPLLGQNTNDCLLSGAIHGTALLLDNAISRIWESMDTTGRTVITGGNAPFIMPSMKATCQYEENLIIKGLFAILDRNGN